MKRILFFIAAISLTISAANAQESFLSRINFGAKVGLGIGTYPKSMSNQFQSVERISAFVFKLGGVAQIALNKDMFIESGLLLDKQGGGFHGSHGSLFGVDVTQKFLFETYILTIPAHFIYQYRSFNFYGGLGLGIYLSSSLSVYNTMASGRDQEPNITHNNHHTSSFIPSIDLGVGYKMGRSKFGIEGNQGQKPPLLRL